MTEEQARREYEERRRARMEAIMADPEARRIYEERKRARIEQLKNDPEARREYEERRRARMQQQGVVNTARYTGGYEARAAYEPGYAAPRTASRSTAGQRASRPRRTGLIVKLVIVAICILAGVLCAVKLRDNHREKQEAALAAQAQETMAQQAAQEEAQYRASVVDLAAAKAASYDYDAAIEMLRAAEDYASDAELQQAVSDYENAKTTLVRWEDPTQVTHVFFHSLIADNARCFDGDAAEDGYNQFMTTTYEFERMLEEMYERGYVLIRIHDLVKQTVNENGETVFTAGDIMLPPGKIPFIMSQDDVNYYEYMIDGDGDHVPDAMGDGFATRIVIGDDGYPTCEYITADGQTVTGDYDLVPILEKFCQQHPDFSYKGARAIIGVTGYEGVLGYRTHPDWEAILGHDAWEQEKTDAMAVAQCLRDHGWEIASHSFGHPAYGDLSAERLAADVQKWEDQCQPIVGDTDIILYPYGSDIAGVENYSGAKYETMYAAGYRFYCNVDSNIAWIHIRDHYVRTGRRNLDGYRMYYNPEMLDDLFNVEDVIDPDRTLPVPPM